MALKGTLKDFGIADILQLIGQQTKTGTLHLKQKDQEVHISFKDGSIVRAESSTRNKKDLIGSMLVRAELITDAQLEFALDIQKRTLKRLGDVLTAQGTVTAEKFKQMVQLQTTETLYKLFHWKTGSYEFEQGDVEPDPVLHPLRAESVLMEGFRMVDEWPVVKKKITSYGMSFKKIKELPPAPLQQDAFDDALDDAFAEEKKVGPKGGEFQSVGAIERRVYQLANSGRTVRKLIDLSMAGEFETCKALCNLVNLEYLRANPGADKADGLNQGAEATLAERAQGMVGRLVVTMLVFAALGFLITQMELGALRQGRGSATTYTDPAAQRFIARQQMSRITAALDVFRLEKGELPSGLGDLVAAGLLSQDDLSYPWRDDYYYRRTEGGAYVLLPPLR
jgi:Domain of unknown function (DUF4388)